MNLIEHANIFELLSLDTSLPEEILVQKLHSMGKRGFMDFLGKNGLSITKTAMSFGSEIKDANGNVLINKDVPVSKYLDALLERYYNDTKFRTSAIKIACTSDVMSYYRGKSIERVATILDDFIFSQDKYTDFYTKVRSNTSEVNALDVFNKSIEYMLTGPDGIKAMVNIFKNTGTTRELLTDNINSAFISLHIAPFCRQSLARDESGGILVKIALTSILQDIASLMDCRENRDCIERSAMIAKSLVNDETIEEAIRVKHCFDKENTVPIFCDTVNKNNLFLRILVTVNQFIEIVKINKTDPGNLEVHKFMYELAELGYADKDVTAYLSKLFLPAVKHLVLQYAYTIKNSCSSNPIIWSTIGDMLPVKFLCPKPDCMHSGQHKTYIPDDVKIEADEIYETRINAGMYNTCKLLTDKLQIYYKSIVQKNEES